MIEQGVKDFTAASYVGVVVPAATSADVVKALEAALKKALNDKGLQEKMLVSGAVLVSDELMTHRALPATSDANTSSRARPRSSPG
jgi:tripartite-type tricarboxylate transporter receptor subunit TctC